MTKQLTNAELIRDLNKYERALALARQSKDRDMARLHRAHCKAISEELKHRLAALR